MVTIIPRKEFTSDHLWIHRGLDLPPDVEHICDTPAEVQPRTGRHQQALQPEGRQGETHWVGERLSSV